MLTDVIENALKGVAKSLPDAVLKMAHGDFTGSAIRTSSNDIGSDVATADGPAEKRRVIVSSSDFPNLTCGCFVRVGSSAYLTTSARQDPVGASTTVGLSDEMTALTVKYSGTRRVNGAVRNLAITLEALGVSRGSMEAFGDAIAPIHTEEWYVVIARETWADENEPEDGDTIEFYTDRLIRMKVADVSAKDGHWLLVCRRRL